MCTYLAYATSLGIYVPYVHVGKPGKGTEWSRVNIQREKALSLHQLLDYAETGVCTVNWQSCIWRRCQREEDRCTILFLPHLLVANYFARYLYHASPTCKDTFFFSQSAILQNRYTKVHGTESRRSVTPSLLRFSVFLYLYTVTYVRWLLISKAQWSPVGCFFFSNSKVYLTTYYYYYVRSTQVQSIAHTFELKIFSICHVQLPLCRYTVEGDRLIDLSSCYPGDRNDQTLM